MKKIYILALLFVGTLSFGQTFTATYDFGLVTATSGSTDPSTVPTASGMTFGSFTALNPTATPPYNSSAGGRFSFTFQPAGATNADNTYTNLTGTLDPTVYYQVTVTPNAGTTYDLSGITFTSQRSGTGIRTYSVRSSADNYAANLSASINPTNAELSVQAGNIFYRVLDATTSLQNGSTITLSGAAFTGISSPVTFRFYGWNSEGTGGTFSIDNVAISGNVTTLSIKENSISGLKVYPNPANTNLFITSDNNEVKEVTVVDVLGKVVLNTKVTNAPINVSALTSGVYMVKVTEAGKTATRKLVIE